MAAITKTIADIVEMWEHTEEGHAWSPFAIEWAFKKPGEEKLLFGVVYHISEVNTYTYEVWEVGT